MKTLLGPARAAARLTFKASLLSLFCVVTSAQAASETWRPYPLVKAENAQAEAMGHSVALWGNTAIAGAPVHDSIEGGKNYDDSGAAYVLRYDSQNERWVRSQLLQAPLADRFDYEEFGTSVDLRGDVAVVGAPQDGDPSLPNPDDTYGAVFVFTRSAADQPFALQQKIIPADGSDGDFFGRAVALGQGSDGALRLVVATGRGSTRKGAAYIFVRAANGQWSQEAKLSSASALNYGCSVAISGDWMAFGACQDGSAGTGAGKVFLYRRDANGWQAGPQLVASQATVNGAFGWRVDMSDDYLFVAEPKVSGAGASAGGRVLVFGRNGSTWSETQVFRSSNPSQGGFFGYDVSVEGQQAAISTLTQQNATGSIDRLNFNAGTAKWERVETLSAKWSGLGVSVDIFGRNLASGASGVLGASGNPEGSVAVFSSAAPASSRPAPVLGGGALMGLGLGLGALALRRRRR